jgi:hypothetical protein
MSAQFLLQLRDWERHHSRGKRIPEERGQPRDRGSGGTGLFFIHVTGRPANQPDICGRRERVPTTRRPPSYVTAHPCGNTKSFGLPGNPASQPTCGSSQSSLLVQCTVGSRDFHCNINSGWFTIFDIGCHI